LYDLLTDTPSRFRSRICVVRPRPRCTLQNNSRKEVFVSDVGALLRPVLMLDENFAPQPQLPCHRLCAR
jgi:hypothetical protein